MNADWGHARFAAPTRRCVPGGVPGSCSCCSLLFGPASSILFGFFGELGPYWLDDSSLANKTTPGVPDVYDNPYAWNKATPPPPRRQHTHAHAPGLPAPSPPALAPVSLPPLRRRAHRAPPVQIANVLFIESPANVGYSYCEDPACRWTDTTGAEANYQALTTFFDAFPEYKDNE